MRLSKGLEFLISQMVIPGARGVPGIPARDAPPASEMGACQPVGRVGGDGSRVIQVETVKVPTLSPPLEKPVMVKEQLKGDLLSAGDRVIKIGEDRVRVIQRPSRKGGR